MARYTLYILEQYYHYVGQTILHSYSFFFLHQLIIICLPNLQFGQNLKEKYNSIHNIWDVCSIMVSHEFAREAKQCKNVG